MSLPAVGQCEPCWSRMWSVPQCPESWFLFYLWPRILLFWDQLSGIFSTVLPLIHFVSMDLYFISYLLKVIYSYSWRVERRSHKEHLWVSSSSSLKVCLGLRFKTVHLNLPGTSLHKHRYNIWGTTVFLFLVDFCCTGDRAQTLLDKHSTIAPIFNSSQHVLFLKKVNCLR